MVYYAHRRCVPVSLGVKSPANVNSPYLGMSRVTPAQNTNECNIQVQWPLIPNHHKKSVPPYYFNKQLDGTDHKYLKVASHCSLLSSEPQARLRPAWPLDMCTLLLVWTTGMKATNRIKWNYTSISLATKQYPVHKIHCDAASGYPL
jgi:hypothetical protein